MPEEASPTEICSRSIHEDNVAAARTARARHPPDQRTAGKKHPDPDLHYRDQAQATLTCAGCVKTLSSRAEMKEHQRFNCRGSWSGGDAKADTQSGMWKIVPNIGGGLGAQEAENRLWFGVKPLWAGAG